MANSPKIDLRVPASWLAKMDERRGDRSQSDFIRDALRRALGPGVEPLRERRGTWIRPKRAAELLKRREINERRRANRKPGKPPAVPEVTFTFTPEGLVQTDDLACLATYAGQVDEHGCYRPETVRYNEARVREEVQKALSAGSLVGDRWERFVARAEVQP